MILVDTSVWSLAFRRWSRPRPEPAAVGLLRQLVTDDQPVGMPGIVLQELLSGVREAKQGKRLRRLLEGYPLFLATREDHVEAAAIFSACRSGGVAASPVDCLLAAQCVTSGSVLLTTDRDFLRIAAHCALDVMEVPER